MGENLRLEVLADGKVGSDGIECGDSKATPSPFFPSSPGPASPEKQAATPTSSRSDPRGLFLLLTNKLIGVEYSPKTNKRLGLKKNPKRHQTLRGECDCIPEHGSAFQTILETSLTNTTVEELKAGERSGLEHPSGLHEDLEDLHDWEAEFLFRAATDGHLSRRNVEPEAESTWDTIQRFVSWS